MIDMHLHTKWSDGSLKVNELVKELFDKNITHAVLTDHDCILGVEEFKNNCKNYNIKAIPGVELEAYYDIKNSLYLHMLCYNYKNAIKLNSFLEEERKNRILAIENAIVKVKKIGVYTNLGEVEKMSEGRHLLINHLCILLEKKHIVKSKFDAYKMFMDCNSEFYVNYPKTSVSDMIKLIYDVGGVPVLAHPKRINMDINEKENYVKQLTNEGLKGIETYYSFDTERERNFSIYLAEKYNLLQTVGSDWHCYEDNINFGNENINQEKIKILKREFFYE